MMFRSLDEVDYGEWTGLEHGRLTGESWRWYNTYRSGTRVPGVDNLKITFWTSIIGLPWTFKLFWGPLVDLNFTKRGWTVAMQVLITGSQVMPAPACSTSRANGAKHGARLCADAWPPRRGTRPPVKCGR